MNHVIFGHDDIVDIFCDTRGIMNVSYIGGREEGWKSYAIVEKLLSLTISAKSTYSTFAGTSSLSAKLRQNQERLFSFGRIENIFHGDLIIVTHDHCEVVIFDRTIFAVAFLSAIARIKVRLENRTP